LFLPLSSLQFSHALWPKPKPLINPLHRISPAGSATPPPSPSRAITGALRTCTARTEIGESSDVLFVRQIGCLVKMDGRHCITPFLLSFVVQDGI
jgi:hypothetical protein